jgi:hypothetical protein
MNLTPDAKLFFIYLITNCDNAGIIDLNIRLAEFQTGIKDFRNSFYTVCGEFGEKRLINLKDNYYFLPNFIRYQYPNGLNSAVKAQQSVVLKLQEFDISPNSLERVNKQLEVSCQTPQDKDIYKDKDKDILRGCGGNFENHNFFDDTELHFSILDYFGFTEMRNPDKLQQVSVFLNILYSDKKIDQFKYQFESYRAYKNQSNTAKHSFPKFLGTIEARFLDGGWNQENWADRLSGINSKKELSDSPFNQQKTQSLRERIIHEQC